MKQSFYPTILYLEDGTYFKGWSFINFSIALGEVVFNTGMTGYQEIITDPSYANQIITFTYPEIGNTGINQEDYESSQIYIKGIISKVLCESPHNWRSSFNLKDYVLDNRIPHIFGVDTRALTKHLRSYGVMNGCISSKILDINTLDNLIQNSTSMKGLDLVSQVTVRKMYEWKNLRNLNRLYSHINKKIRKQDYPIVSMLHIVVIDFGVKYNILSRLQAYGCKITILPASSKFNTILGYKPSGILLSNGPGDPSVINYSIRTVQQLIKFTNIPIFGICMGHQILSLALGSSTFKLKFGHRGLNHPSGKNQNVEITSQNHGFAVNIQSMSNTITHINLNDLTLAGMRHLNKPIFSVQYHPEASPGPHDSEYLFHVFLKLIKLIKSIESDTFLTIN